MSGGNGQDSPGGHGGKIRTGRLPSGLTERQERLLARRALKARMGESKAGALAAPALAAAAEQMAKDVEEGGLSATERRRTVDTLLTLTKRAQEADPGATSPEEAENKHIHIHVTPDTLDAALGHLDHARRGERVNGVDEG